MQFQFLYEQDLLFIMRELPIVNKAGKRMRTIRRSVTVKNNQAIGEGYLAIGAALLLGLTSVFGRTAVSFEQMTGEKNSFF